MIIKTIIFIILLYQMDQYNLICPITQQVFYEPVVADDGYIYEKDAIEEWLRNKKISPMTRESISEKVISLQFMKTLVGDYLTKNPQMKARQYIGTKQFKKYSITIFEHIKNHEFSKLLDYDEYITDTLDSKILKINGKKKERDVSYLEYLLMNCKDESIITYVIDNLNVISDSLALYMARYSSEELNIKYEEKTTLRFNTKFNWNPFHFFIKRNFVQIIEKIGKNYSYQGLNDRTKKNESPLMMAINRNNLDIVNIFLQYEMHVTIDDIVYAIKYRLHYDTIKKMFDLCREDVNIKISSIASCVSVNGQYNGYKEFIKYMLYSDSLKKNDDNKEENNKEENNDEEEECESNNLNLDYPLIATLCKGTSSIEIIKMFIDKGFSVNVLDDEGYCGWMQALHCRRFKLFEYMLPKIDFTIRSLHGTSMIHWLAQNAKYSLIRKMISEYKFDLNEIANKQSPLTYALENNNSQVCQILIDNGADINLQIESKSHIMLAIKYHSRDFKFMKSCISKCQQLETEYNGFYPVHYACIYGTRELIKLFFDMNINLNIKSKYNKNLIHILCIRQNLNCGDLIKYLIEVKKIDIEEYDMLGFKPFHYILLNGSFEMIKFMKKITKDQTINLKIRKSHQQIIAEHSYLCKFLKYNEIVDLLMDNPYIKEKVKASLGL